MLSGGADSPVMVILLEQFPGAGVLHEQAQFDTSGNPHASR